MHDNRRILFQSS